MSYLGKIAARVVDQPQPIRPRLASLFEPVPGPKIRFVETKTHRQARAPMSELSNAMPAPDPPRASPPGVEQLVEGTLPETDRIIPANVETPRSTDRTRAVSRHPSRTIAAPNVSEPRPVRPADTAIQTAARPRDATDRPRSLSVRETLQTERSDRDRSVPEEIVVTEVRMDALPDPSPELRSDDATPNAPFAPNVTVMPSAAGPQSSTAGRELPESSPTVRITIGRVDVRAIMPEAPAPPAPQRPSATAKPALSLDAYLKQRNGGRG